MTLIYHWANVAMGWATSAAQQRPFTALTLAVIFLGAASIVAADFLSNFPKRYYPIAGVNKGQHIFHEIQNRLYWFKCGPLLIHEAYEKNHNAIYELPSLDRTSIVLPARFLKEVKELPYSIASNSHATSDFFVGTWTTLDYDIFGHANLEAIRSQFITKIGWQVAPALDELTYAFPQQFESYPDWTPIAPQPKVLQLVAQMVARTVVGPDICRNPEWVASVIDYAQNVFMAAICFKLVPNFLRGPLAALTPYMYRIYKCRRKIFKIVSPAINHALFTRRQRPDEWATKVKTEQMNTIDWLVKLSPPTEATPEMIAHRLTGVSFGASHTTSNHVTNCILDLASDFKRWAPPLREEIESVLGPNPTTITNANLSKMWKLDSFMKETQRFHPPSKLSVNRKILQPFSLSSGEPLPRDAHISFPGVPMSMSEEYFQDARSFDGFRFERMRHDTSIDHSGLQFTSSYEGSLHFGHGRHMCPGRFMGSLMSKLLIIELLQRYDLQLREGQDRPLNIMFMDMDIPDPKYEVLFRDRRFR